MPVWTLESNFGGRGNARLREEREAMEDDAPPNPHLEIPNLPGRLADEVEEQAPTHFNTTPLPFRTD
jgi:hypothetical protein